MKDPITFGAAVSAGAMLLLATWKAPVPRWIVIFLLLGGLCWAFAADPKPPQPAQHPAAQAVHA
jgi:hypothetical protein